MEIYGPLGLRKYIRTCLELSRSYVTYQYIVHEMIPIDDQIPQGYTLEKINAYKKLTKLNWFRY